MTLHIVDHPLLHDIMARLRDRHTSSDEYRALTYRASTFLIVEATRDLPTREDEIETPLETTTGRRLGSRVVAVPILRAGLGMLQGFDAELEEAMRIADALGDDARSALARFRRMVGMLLGQDRGRTKELAEETIVYAQRAGDRCLEAASRGALARLALHTTGGEGLIERMEKNVRIFEEDGRQDWAWTARSVIADRL